MKYLLLTILLIPILAFADQYTASVGWTDPTPPGPLYTPKYDVELTNGAQVAVVTSDLATPAFSTTITAAPGDTVKFRVRERNTQGPMVGNWSAFIIATAPTGPTVPGDPAGVSFTMTWKP
jgi:hypothetical protein